MHRGKTSECTPKFKKIVRSLSILEAARPKGLDRSTPVCSMQENRRTGPLPRQLMCNVQWVNSGDDYSMDRLGVSILTKDRLGVSILTT